MRVRERGHSYVKGEIKIMVLSVLLGLAVWLINPVMDCLLFREHPTLSYFDHLFNVSAHETYMRALAFAVIVAFGLIVARAYARRRKMTEELDASNQQLRAATQQLAVNEQQLRASNQQLVAAEQQLRAAIEQLREDKRSIEAEKENANRYLDVAGVIMVVLDTEGRVTLINKKGCEILRRRREDILGKKWIESFVPQQTQTDVSTVFHSLTKDSQDFFEYFQNPVIDADGKEHMIAWHNVPLTDEHGKICGTLSSGADVTDLRKAEKQGRELAEKLSRAEKMESLGMLAGGVAHDLNNILTPATALPDLILGDLDRITTKSDLTQIKGDIAAIREAGRTACDVIRDLLTLSRRGHYRMEPVDVGKLVHSYINSPGFLGALGRHPAVVFEPSVSPGLKAILGSDSHLVQVVMNLTTNALEAMPNGGKLGMAVSDEYVQKRLGTYETVDEGEYIIVKVKDTGTGIKREDIRRIFEPFYSQKKLGTRSGSGLGLAVVLGVVKDHGGFIDVKTEVGKGSQFIVYLPVTEEQPQLAKDSGIRRGSESILVVDDVERQRQLCSRLFSSLGYKVSVASTAAETVRLFADAKDAGRKSPFDLVILDMIMEEEKDGLDIYREIVERYSKQKCIIVSGFSETDRVMQAKQLGVGKFVAKPYLLKDLAEAVRKELDGGK